MHEELLPCTRRTKLRTLRPMIMKVAFPGTQDVSLRLGTTLRLFRSSPNFGIQDPWREFPPILVVESPVIMAIHYPLKTPPPPGRLVLSKGEYTIAEDKAGRGVFVRGLTEVEVRAFTFILNGDCLSFVIFYL